MLIQAAHFAILGATNTDESKSLTMTLTNAAGEDLYIYSSLDKK